jgi:hypothetical protein
MHLPQGLAYSPGQIINGAIEINNPKHIRITRIECTVDQALQIGDDIYIVNIIKINLPKITNTNKEIRKETFEIQLLDDLPPSYDFALNDVPNCRTVIIKYEIKFMVRVIGILSDFETVKLISIATTPSKHTEDETVLINIMK